MNWPLWIVPVILVAAALIVGHRRYTESIPGTPTFRRFPTGTCEAPTQAAVPRVLWSYWHSAELPLVVSQCLENWAHHNPGYAIHLVNAANFSQFVDAADLPSAFARASPARQSDWMRLYLLHRYGGIWLDASIILTRSLDWLIDGQRTHGAEFAGFYLDRYTVRPDDPIIDSWCLAAPEGSRFIADWYRELNDEALRLGDAAYLARLEAEGQLVHLRQNIADPAYLIIHMCAQRVLHRNAVSSYRLALTRAEDSAYYYQSLSNWRRPRLYARLLLWRHPLQPAPLIKLRGGERRKLEAYLRHGRYRRDSLVGRQLANIQETPR